MKHLKLNFILLEILLGCTCILIFFNEDINDLKLNIFNFCCILFSTLDFKKFIKAGIKKDILFLFIGNILLTITMSIFLGVYNSFVFISIMSVCFVILGHIILFKMLKLNQQ